ncbi:MAG: MFS transporter [Phycisphaeraceae bacterium]|jgi:MFS family permease|nr:MFS transporter [Phycisphaeraceae bacterium]
MRALANPIYLLLCLFDFAAFLIVFAIGRALADSYEPKMAVLQLGMVGALTPLGSLVTCLPGGWLSDHIGRRRLVLSGCVLVFAAPGLAFIQQYHLASLIIGLSAGLAYPAAIAWASQGKPPGNQRGGVSNALIMTTISWNLGLMAGFAFGGVLYEISAAWPIGAAAIIILLNLVLAIVMRPPVTDKHIAPEPTSMEHANQKTRSAAFAKLSWIANVASSFSMSIYIYLTPQLFVQIGIPAGEHGITVGTSRFVVIIFYMLMHATAFWHHRFSTSLCAQAMGVIGMLVFFNASQAWHLWLAMGCTTVMGVYNYFSGLYYSISGATERRKGLASSIHEATLCVGFAAGAALGGTVGYFVDVRAPYILAAAVIVVFAVVQVGVHRRWTHAVHARTR